MLYWILIETLKTSESFDFSMMLNLSPFVSHHLDDYRQSSPRWLRKLKGKFVYRGPKPYDPDRFTKVGKKVLGGIRFDQQIYILFVYIYIIYIYIYVSLYIYMYLHIYIYTSKNFLLQNFDWRRTWLLDLLILPGLHVDKIAAKASFKHQNHEPGGGNHPVDGFLQWGCRTKKHQQLLGYSIREED